MMELSPLTVPTPQTASLADLSPPSALPRQTSAQQQDSTAGSPDWQANPVAQTVAAASSQLPADLQRPSLLSSSSHAQVRHDCFAVFDSAKQSAQLINTQTPCVCNLPSQMGHHSLRTKVNCTMFVSSDLGHMLGDRSVDYHSGHARPASTSQHTCWGMRIAWHTHGICIGTSWMVSELI